MHVCRHTYCLNQAKAGMNPKTLQYLMGHSDISVTMNVYTHIGFDDAEEELKRMEEFWKAQSEIEKKNEKPASQRMFKVILHILYPQIIYVFLTIFLYLLNCPQSLILSALRAFCFCGKPHISRSIFLYFRYQSWLKSW